MLGTLSYSYENKANINTRNSMDGKLSSVSFYYYVFYVIFYNKYSFFKNLFRYISFTSQSFI